MRSMQHGRRSWLYGALFFVLALGLAAAAPPPSPLFSIEANLVFTPPNSVGSGNALRADSSNVIYFAAAVERQYNVTPELARVASSNATLYGIGVRDGSRVTLTNRGGQWGSNFDRPYLRVEVVSSSAEQSQARFDAVVGELRSIARRRQVAVPPSETVTLELNPSTPGVQRVSGHYSRQLVAAVLLGALGASAIIAVTGRRRRAPSARVLAAATA